MDIEFKGRRLWFLALVASLGGFLYGYDTAVIAGGEQQIQSGWGLSPFVHGFVMSSALWGTVIWVFIAEVFPQGFRARGQSLGSSTHWGFNAAITFVIPTMAALLPTWGIFAIFGGFMVIHLVWAIFIVPETKGQVLEDIKV